MNLVHRALGRWFNDYVLKRHFAYFFNVQCYYWESLVKEKDTEIAGLKLQVIEAKRALHALTWNLQNGYIPESINGIKVPSNPTNKYHIGT